MNEEKLKKYYSVYTDCWKFFRKYVELIEKVDSKNPPTEGMLDSDSYWEVLVYESSEIYEKHRNTPFAKGLLVATTKEIERIYKEGRK